MFTTQSHAENLALLRAVIEAKFHIAPSDTDVPGSAVLAGVAVRLREAVVAEEVRREGAIAAERWRQWSALSPSRPEWSAAVQFATTAWRDCWDGWSADERNSAAVWLLSPFEAEPAQIKAFLNQIGVLLLGEAR